MGGGQEREMHSASTNKPIFILSAAVVSVEFEVSFSKTVVVEVMVEKTYYTVSSLSNIHALINKVIYL